MQGKLIETVGEGFQEDLLMQARDKALEIIERVAAKVTAGLSEVEVKQILADTQAELGAPKSWHPPQIRFGENTLLPFGVLSRPDVRLKENDIFFLDIGPIYADHEGDVGRPFVLGDDADMAKCCTDAKEIWFEVQKHWRELRVTGAELYEFAELQATKRGWQLSLQKADGHRVADFPHVAKGRGSIQGYDKRPESNRWILEIQIRHPTKAFGAFYEDLLN